MSKHVASKNDARSESQTNEPERPRFDAGGPIVDKTLDELGIDRAVAGETITTAARFVAEVMPDVVESMRGVVRLASSATREARKSLPVFQAACAEKCDACCHLHVSISAPEALVLAAFLRDTLSPERLAEVRARVQRVAKRVKTFNQGERLHARVACPLLEGGSCIAYPVRPLACAGASSADADACDRALAGENVGIPIDPALHGAMRAARIGVGVGLLAKGLDFRRYELANALAIALANEDAAERFARGETLFEGAATPADASATSIHTVAHAFVSRDDSLR
ncbi:MAG: hypothetical protein ACXVEF_37190 [Polyangiales bacterium]